jgi:uncharacterized protein with HEPN domain
MPKRDPELLLEDMLTAVRKIERYTAGMDQEEFRRDEKTLDAVVRNLEVLGEAARQLPDEFLARSPEVPWRQIAGLRNRVIHEYFGLDIDLIWEVVLHDLPQLRTELERLA